MAARLPLEAKFIDIVAKSSLGFLSPYQTSMRTGVIQTSERSYDELAGDRRYSNEDGETQRRAGVGLMGLSELGACRGAGEGEATPEPWVAVGWDEGWDVGWTEGREGEWSTRGWGRTVVCMCPTTSGWAGVGLHHTGV